MKRRLRVPLLNDFDIAEEDEVVRSPIAPSIACPPTDEHPHGRPRVTNLVVSWSYTPSVNRPREVRREKVHCVLPRLPPRGVCPRKIEESRCSAMVARRFPKAKVASSILVSGIPPFFGTMNERPPAVRMEGQVSISGSSRQIH